MAGGSSCPSDNTQAVDQTSFWGKNGVDWDTHRIGWAVSGACALVVRAASLISLSSLSPITQLVIYSDRPHNSRQRPLTLSVSPHHLVALTRGT